MYSFDGLEAVESTMGRLTASSGEEGGIRPLAMVLPRQPGSREARYAHLLGGPVEVAVRETGAESRGHSSAEPTLAARISELEAEVAALRAAVARISERMDGGSRMTEAE
jgi:hypothetical protein